MSNFSDQIESYARRVKELADHEHVRGNEQATKFSLIGPLFTLLGYDIADPRECVPEYKVDFGKDRSTKPIDWAFRNNESFIFFVEAKEAGKKLGGYHEQLADYFAKDSNVKLGILSNGVHWKFFTDADKQNIMDKEPFAEWNVLLDDVPPYDVIKLLQKASFNAENIRTYAQRQRKQSLLVRELEILLEPSSDFIKLAVEKFETRNRVQSVLDEWKKVVANALTEWARQHVLKTALSATPSLTQDAKAEPSKIDTTQYEIDAFEEIKKILGLDCPIAYEDSVAYFKIHLDGKRTWVFARLQLDRKIPNLWVPLPKEQAEALASGRQVTIQSGWSVIPMDSATSVSDLGELLRVAYSHVKQARESGSTEE